MKAFGEVNPSRSTCGDDVDGLLRPQLFVYFQLFSRYLCPDIVPRHVRFGYGRIPRCSPKVRFRTAPSGAPVTYLGDQRAEVFGGYPLGIDTHVLAFRSYGDHRSRQLTENVTSQIL